MWNLGNRIVNNWIYAIPEGYVLIDTGYEGGCQRVKRRLAADGLNVGNIRYVFLTHAHDDHAGFLNDILAEAQHAQVIASGKAMEVLRRGQNSFAGGCTGKAALAFCNWMKRMGKGAHRFPPIKPEFEERILLVTNENRVAMGKRLHGTIIDTPGHTADSISLLLDDGSLFCGDAAMNGIPSVNRITIWAEDREAFAQSWQTIIGLRPAKIYPGHGKPFDYRDLERNWEKVCNLNVYPLDGAE